MDIAFWKMHGAGNDFILVDDRDGSFPCDDRDWLVAVAARRTGVGCDGVILIQPSDGADFRMRFFNPDGAEAEMCGNGARCVARLASELGVAAADMRIETQAGLIRAQTDGDQVRLHMTAPVCWRPRQVLDLAEGAVAYTFLDTGAPHAVVETDDLDGVDVRALGAAIRRHEAFRPAGTNADFISVAGPQSLRIRTYERGVEDETLACGTGIVAGALVAVRAGRVTSPVTVIAASGDTLEVSFRLTGEGAEGVVLRGPAAHVFRGTLRHGGD